jgi:hypothetical protein
MKGKIITTDDLVNNSTPVFVKYNNLLYIGTIVLERHDGMNFYGVNVINGSIKSFNKNILSKGKIIQII